jgi:hypothetical protein
MAKVIFELQGRVSYHTLNGVVISSDAAYWNHMVKNDTAGLEYHENVVFYSKRFEGKKVWDTIDVIEQYRRQPNFRTEILEAAQAKNIDLSSKLYHYDVMPERVRE